MLNNIKYPPYRQAQDVESFLNSGSIIVSGTEVKRRTAEVMEREGFPVPENLLEDFIVISFQDAIANMVKYNEGESVASITVIETIHPDKKWPGTTSWVTDYVELLLGKAIERNPFGVWDVFFRNGDLYIFNQGNYAYMLHSYLKSQGKLPDLNDVLSHGFFDKEAVVHVEDEIKHDIYVRTRVSASLLHENLVDGKYVDVNTGKVIKSFYDITGAVRESNPPRTVISQEDFETGLCVREREETTCQE